MLFLSVYGMVLHSSFDAKQASMIFPSHSDPVIFIDRRPSPTTDLDYVSDFLFVAHKNPPAVLVRTDCEATHMFLHYNFTMLRCLWGTNMAMYDKISVFRDMSQWLQSHNHSLTANFYEPDDWLAWNIAEFPECEESEHHFD